MLREKRGEMVLKMLHLCVLMAANLNKRQLERWQPQHLRDPVLCLCEHILDSL